MKMLDILTYPRVRMAIVGAVSLAVAYSFFLLLLAAGAHYQLASVTNFFVYVLCNFFGNKLWAFKRVGNTTQQAVQHFSLHAGNQLLIMAGLFVLVEWARVHPAFAQVVMQVLVLVLVFTITPRIFGHHRED